EIFSYRPYSTHQWRQSDCLSITMNYFKDNRPFFKPAIHWVGEKDGQTVSEFPIIYFFNAQMWKIFGHREFIPRLTNILIVFMGLFLFFKLCRKILGDNIWPYLVTFLLFSSPIFVYYTNNYMADAPALGLALTACYLIYTGYTENNRKVYYLSFLFFLLCGLIKISSLIVFVSIMAVHLYVSLFSKKHKGWFFNWKGLMPYFIVIIGLASWYSYARSYNSNHVAGIFLTSLFPIWDIDAENRQRIWDCLTNNLLPAYFNKKALFVIMALFIACIALFKKSNKLFLSITGIVFTGVIMFIILFYKAFDVHDYYLTNLLIFVPLPLITILHILKNHYNQVYQSKILKTILIISA
ncbi:MAG: glycosyltransferase family 39 protein, partial [Bacteroidales bacterium]|nr:glycosyltransferase family 39 protein [Bacteroidales bacterium]